MKTKGIVFTGPKTAELLIRDVPAVGSGDVLVKMEYTVVSGGTERACLMAMKNVCGFPSRLGYCGIGIVEAVGDDVKSVKCGDRVLTYHGTHAEYNVRPECDVYPVLHDEVPSLDASVTVIAAMGLGGARKLELELGESAMVMGMGLLGIFALQFLRQSGAMPLIAADLNPERRALALELGADYALDPADPDFVKTVKKITGGKGVRGTVEVTGVSAAMKQALECASWMGRISLLGCTRVSDCEVDYYTAVHRPGVKLIGAHNFVRPKFESYPHHWTMRDDCMAIIEMLARGRIKSAPILTRVCDPKDAPSVYTELCDDPNFPLGTVFKWN